MPALSAPPVSSAFNTQAPQISKEEIERIIHDAYGFSTAATLLSSERDVTAHVLASNGMEYVFKVANSAENPLVIQFQNQAMSHIHATNGSLPVPLVVRSKEGLTEIQLQLGSHLHVAKLLSYLHGIPVYKTASTRAQRRAMGATLAQLSMALKDFHHSAASHEILWDLKHTARLRTLTSHITDTAKRHSVEKVFDHFCASIKPREALFRKQVVHNDFNPHNVLLSPGNHDEVSGILDFGDIVATPLIYDVAVACSYHVPQSGQPLSEAVDFLAAYNDVCPLLAEEIDMLFDLINTRNAMTVTITEWRAKRYPENSAYILRNNPRATLALAQFSSISREQTQATFREACRIK